MLGLFLGLATRAISYVRKLFSPAELFANGEQGAWYDPSDLTTMWQDAAGTTPVTAVEQPVGLILDKSKGLVLGPELVTNGGFTNGTTGWTGINATLAVVGGAVEITATGSAQARASQAVTTVSGRWYEARATIWQGAGALNVDLLVSGIASSAAVSSTTPTAVVVRFLATSSSTTIRVGSTGSAVIGTTFFADNIAVRELPGNHATQATSIKRPVLSARYNLLTKTEDFSDAAWTKSNATVVADAIAAPDGSITADKLVEDTQNTQHHVRTAFTATNSTLTLSVYAKAAERNFMFIQLSNNATGAAGALFNLAAGTAQAATNGGDFTASSSSIVALGAGWYRCSLTTTKGAVNNAAWPYITASNGSASYLGDGTSGIYIWGASLVPADQASLPYQRVNTSTDYDTVGFKHYLKFDGVDDALATGSIDFTATDKMTVVAGVRKLSDAARGMIVELNSPTTTNFFNVDANNGSYSVISRGNQVTNITATMVGYAAPITTVVTSLNSLIDQTVAIRGNAGSFTTGSATGITGNYGNYPLYIGSRAGTSLPFNGHLYSLIVRGAQSTNAQIVSAETYVAGKTGVIL